MSKLSTTIALLLLSTILAFVAFQFKAVPDVVAQSSGTGSFKQVLRQFLDKEITLKVSDGSSFNRFRLTEVGDDYIRVEHKAKASDGSIRYYHFSSIKGVRAFSDGETVVSVSNY